MYSYKLPCSIQKPPRSQLCGWQSHHALLAAGQTKRIGYHVQASVVLCLRQQGQGEWQGEGEGSGRCLRLVLNEISWKHVASLAQSKSKSAKHLAGAWQHVWRAARDAAARSSPTPPTLPLSRSFSISLCFLYPLPSVTLFAALAGNCQANWLHQLRLRLSLSKPDLSVISMTWSPAAGESCLTSSCPPRSSLPLWPPLTVWSAGSWLRLCPACGQASLLRLLQRMFWQLWSAINAFLKERGVGRKEGKGNRGRVRERRGGKVCDCLWHADCHKLSGKCNWIYCNWNWD